MLDLFIKMIVNPSTLQKFIFVSRKIFKPCSPYITRTFHCNKHLLDNYEGDGKTVVTVLNREHKELIMINSMSNMGFRLNNGVFVVGPIAVFPRTVLQWNVRTVDDITPENISLFHILEPKLDLLIIGTGDKQLRVSQEVIQLLQSKKIALEVLSTENACATFNFLNVERRCLAAAFLTPENVFISYEETRLLGTNENLEVMDINLDPHTPKSREWKD